jgi:hypothetical protein
MREVRPTLSDNLFEVIIYSRDELGAVSLAIQSGPSHAAER